MNQFVFTLLMSGSIALFCAVLILLFYFVGKILLKPLYLRLFCKKEVRKIVDIINSGVEGDMKVLKFINAGITDKDLIFLGEKVRIRELEIARKKALKLEMLKNKKVFVWRFWKNGKQNIRKEDSGNGFDGRSTTDRGGEKVGAVARAEEGGGSSGAVEGCRGFRSEFFK